MAKRYLTIREFLDMLSPDDEWRLDDHGNLMDCNDHCPLWNVFVARYETNENYEEVEDYIAAGVECGLRTRDAVAIAQAADKRGRHSRLRKWLLQAVGVEEIAARDAEHERGNEVCSQRSGVDSGASFDSPDGGHVTK
jgi:hypothetical protein